MTRRFLVTAALPYANNRLHLGHVAGAYLPADIYVRYLRMLGDDVIFICGSDDYGVPVTISAQKEACSPQEVADRYRRLQQEAFRALGIEFDIYSGTSICRHHAPSAQEFFAKIHAAGKIVPRETEQFYCPRCDRFLPDRYVEGTCPFCKQPEARGDQCDACGRAFEQTELIDPYCATCRSRPEIRRTKHWFFQLDSFREALRAWLGDAQGWRENVRNYALGTLRDKLPDRSITRDLSWGVPVPLAGADGKVLYVWFDAPIGYWSFTKELFEQRGDAEGWRRYWQDPETRLLHFIGKDNIIFHAVIWPAMLLAFGDLVLPANVPANEYLNFKGEKLSKSRGNAVWLDDMLARYEADRVRYYLTAIAPEGRDSNFTFEEFTARNNEVLSDVLGNFFHRVFTFAERHLGGRQPKGVAGDARARGLLAKVAEARDRWQDALEGLRFKEALAAAVDLGREGNRYFDAAEPWKTRKSDPARCALDIGASLELASALSVLLAPYLPATAARLRAALALPAAAGNSDVEGLGRPLIAEGAPLASPGILFPKLDQEAAT
ncbi:MAG: methionine--tRNA ligase [Planctomycetes bacterium]|nr:methionine--tRNA ligase [Planctomycetota bacterium]